MVKQKAWFGPSQWGWALLIIVIATAVFLRFYQLGEVPPGLYRDEAFNGLDALGVINGRHALFFTTNNGREPAYIYLTSLFIRWFGRTPLAVRMGAAVIGSATAWLTYQMAAEWFDKRVGLLAAWLWAVTLWPLHLSRIGLRPILLPFALAAAAWLCAVAYRQQKWWVWLLAGSAYGAAFYTYLASRFTPLFLLLFFVFLWWRSDRKKLWPGLAWFCVGTAVFLIPWALLFLQQPELILGRSGQVSIFNPIINGGDLWGTLWRQIGRGVGMFFWRGDDILRHNPAARPVFDWATAVPFLMGVSWCIKQWRKPAAMLLLLWSTVMLGPTILAEDAPHFLRAVGLLPAILIFPAIGFNQLWQWQRLPRWGRQTAVLLLLVISFGLTLRDYQAYSQDPEAAFLFEMAALTLGEQIRDEAVDTAVYMDRWFWDDVRQQGWSAVPFIADLEDVVVYRPEFGLSLPQSGQAVSVYAWQFGSLAFVPQLINAPAHVTITSGQLARGDLEPSSYPLYVRYHAQPVIHSQDVVANFENQFLLRQLTAELLPHNQLRITMEWEQGTAVSQNLNSFIHIIDVDGIMAQDDAPPGGTLWQPNWWQPGIIVEDQRIIQLAEPFDPEMHQIQVGLYQPETNVRLIATDTSGQALGDAVSTFLLHD